MRCKFGSGSKLIYGIALGLSALLISACGGGGGGGGGVSGLEYTGLTTPVEIDETNAKAIGDVAYEGADTSDSFVLSSAQQPQATGSRLNMPGIARLLQGAVQRMETIGGTQPSLAGAIVTVNETIPSADNPAPAGYCGGSMVFNLSVDDVTLDFSGSISFNDYCEDDVTMSGGASFSGAVDLAGDFASFSMNFSNLTATDTSESLTMSGTVSFSSGTSETMTMNLVMRDNISGETFRFENFAVRVTDMGSYDEVTITGRVYHPDHGYVDITTPVALRVLDADEYPSAGQIVLTGANGSMGGATTATITFTTANDYTLDVDTDGDGTDDVMQSCTWDPDVCS